VSRFARVLIAAAFAVTLLLFGRQAAAFLPAFAVWVQSLGPWGPMAFVVAYGIAAVLILPCVLLTLAAGALWGVGRGLLYAMTGASLGAALAFLTARYVLRRFVQEYVDRHPRLAAIDRAVEAEGFRLMFLLRLSPIVPYTLLNYVLGVSRVRFREFLGGLAGMVPAALMYVYAGKVIGDVASIATGARAPRDAAYYTLLGFGLAATVLASILIARAAARAVQART
jgi:uncharacterized membrane protein YdjX (TVP38/TMEM64 family)